MTTRDEIWDLIAKHRNDNTGAGELADRILALLPPREPTEAMVEAMAFRIDRAAWYRMPSGMQVRRKQSLKRARAAWAAAYAAGEEQ